MDYFCGENSGKFVFCLKETRKRRMQFGLHSPELVIHIMILSSFINILKLIYFQFLQFSLTVLSSVIFIEVLTSIYNLLNYQ